MVIPTIDVLVKEQLEFVERVNSELDVAGRWSGGEGGGEGEGDGEGKVGEKIEAMVVEGAFHGWLELPTRVVGEESRQKVFERCLEVLKQAYAR